MNTRRIAVVLLACWAGASAAQTVYRCGPDGRSYSQQPCPEGRRVEAGDARTAAQRAQGEAASQRDAKAAESLERQRRAAERAAPPRPVALDAPKAKEVKTATAPKPKKRSKTRHAPTENADFRAVEVLPPPAKQQR